MNVHSTPSHGAIRVVLGSQTIKAFVAAPRQFKVLGIVRMGLEFGLLATNSEGVYVRVNGSTVGSLNQDAVNAAIALASTTGRGESYATSRKHQLAVPTVVVRRRRVVALLP